MNFYQTKTNKLSGERYGELKKNAILIIKQSKRKSKKKSYLRSAYFGKEKIFFDFFLQHLFEKNPKERVERLQFFPAGLDLIKNSRNQPTLKTNPNKRNEVLYRFYGITKDKNKFCVQIKENKKTGRKYFMSCFSWK